MLLSEFNIADLTPGVIKLERLVPANAKNKVIDDVMDDFHCIVMQTKPLFTNEESWKVFWLSTEMSWINVLDKAYFKKYGMEYSSLSEGSIYKGNGVNGNKNERTKDKLKGRPDLIMEIRGSVNKKLIFEGKAFTRWVGRVKPTDFEMKNTYSAIMSQLSNYCDKPNDIRLEDHTQVAICFQWFYDLKREKFIESIRTYARDISKITEGNDFYYFLYSLDNNQKVHGLWICGKVSEK